MARTKAIGNSISASTEVPPRHLCWSERIHLSPWEYSPYTCIKIRYGFGYSRRVGLEVSHDDVVDLVVLLRVFERSSAENDDGSD